MFCFDNTFSAVSEKIIFFELILDNMEANEEQDEWKEYVHGTDSLDMKLEDIMVRMLDAVQWSECVRFRCAGPPIWELHHNTIAAPNQVIRCSQSLELLHRAS